MIKLKTKSICASPNERFYKFLNYAEKYHLKKNLLVIGSSDGTYVIPAAKKGFEVTALDIDKEAIYGGKPLNIDGKKVEYLGLKKRIELENDINDKVNYAVCDYMEYNTQNKYSLIFTSGSILYDNNKKYELDQMIAKMIDLLADNGILLLEYIVKDDKTDNSRHFISQEELNQIFSKYENIKIISHKTKKYLEKAYSRESKNHEICWGRVYLQKKSAFVDDYESAKYYDALPRFSKDVYDYLKTIGVYNKKVADVGSGTGRIAIDLLENKNTVYAIDPDQNMRDICENKCKKYHEKFISIDGNDSNMNIANKSVDYVIVSQSFHRFNPFKFKKECQRVLKKESNVIIMWYRVDFENAIIARMLKSLKENYSKYQSRYAKEEILGAKEEEIANNESAKQFYGKNWLMNEVVSTSILSKEEFITLGLSLALFPITHEMNTVTKVLESKEFNKDKYLKDLNAIFNKFQKDNKIKLTFKVQIHSNHN